MERRTFERIACGNKRLAVKDLVNMRQFEAQCLDVGGGGIGLELAFPLRLMHVLELKLNTGSSASVKLKGKAVWQKQTGHNWQVGISFLPSSRLLDLRVFLKP